ncbi:hypothetical protein [Paenibacillus sp. FSL P4-0081]|uniref:hypothetical protein n=1 Tax=Paenibacillus sp. FSL P4-0081 TaxID=1536769 RepID=UPI0012E05160|nr:hypothetical protein [Paenibacillus sp. FSL P4-0081]
MIVRQNNKVVIRNTLPAAADNQEALRRHFLELRARSIPGMVNHEEIFADAEGMKWYRVNDKLNKKKIHQLLRVGRISFLL